MKSGEDVYGVVYRARARNGNVGELAAVGQLYREASQTRDYCVAKIATQRAARPDSSLRKERLFGMTIKRHHCLAGAASGEDLRRRIAERVN
jgi:hypothetical protein